MILGWIKLFIINTILAISTLIPQPTLSVGLVGQPVSFIPDKIQNDSESIVSNLVYRRLFKYSEGELVNDLVNSVKISDDKREYNIELKKNIFWQDGVPISSNDIIHTLIKKEELINDIDIEKISDKEVKIILRGPLGILPPLLTFGLEPAHLGIQNELQPIGSTSYRISRVERERTEVKSVILQSFKRQKQYPKIIFRFYDTQEDLMQAYSLGEISAYLSDIDVEIPNATQTRINYLGRYFTLIFNMESEKLQSLENRESLIKSLDILKLLGKNFYNKAEAAIGPVSRSPYTKDIFTAMPYDPENKLSAAQKSYLNGLNIILPDNPDGRQVESFLIDAWGKSLGIELSIEYLDIDQLVERAHNSKFDVLFAGHEVTPDPDRYVFWHSTQIDSLNLGRFQDLRADKSLEEGRLEADFEKRKVHYNIFQDVMATKLPAFFLYHPGTFLYTSSRTPIPIPENIYSPKDIFGNL